MNNELIALKEYLRSQPVFLNNLEVTTKLSTILSSMDIVHIDYSTELLLFGADGKAGLSDSLQTSNEATVNGRDWIDFAVLHFKTGLNVSEIQKLFNVGIKEHQLYSLCEKIKYTVPYRTSISYTFGSKGSGRKQETINFRCRNKTVDCGLPLFGVVGFNSIAIESSLKALCFSNFKFKKKPSTKVKLRDYEYDSNFSDTVSLFISKYSEIYTLMRVLGASKEVALYQLEQILDGEVPESQFIYFEDLVERKSYTFLNYKELCALLDIRLNTESNNHSQYIRKNFIFRYIADEYVNFLSGKSDNEFLVSWSYWLSLRLGNNLSYCFKKGYLLTSLRDDCLSDYGIDETVGFVGVSSRELTDITKLKVKGSINSFSYATSLKLSNED